MINIDNISFSYGDKPIINNFSLKIEKNSRICLFGESGCGKTTVLRLLLGLETPDSGTISGLLGLKPSVVFQEDILLPFKTVLENITLIGASEDVAINNLEKLGIGNSANSYPNKLSGGMRRRAAIARALSSDFDFLVLDEPFTGLDEGNLDFAAKHILDVLKDRPLIMVTHSKREAQLLDTNIINM